MTTVRDLLELGFPEYAKKALQENGGQAPLCCVFVSDVDKWSCLWLLKKGRGFLSFDVFEKECLRCQDEMLMKLKKKKGEIE